MTLTKAFLKDLLQTKNLNIKFKKKDGSERLMLCTLRREALPVLSETEETSKTKKQENEEVLAVWDLEKNAFRSFRLDSIIEYKEKL